MRCTAKMVAMIRNAKAPKIPYWSARFCCFLGSGRTRTASTRALSALRIASRTTSRPIVRKSEASTLKGIDGGDYRKSAALGGGAERPVQRLLGGRDVHRFDVLLHHAPRGEGGRHGLDRPADHAKPPVGNSIRIPFEVETYARFLQRPIARFRVALVHRVQVGGAGLPTGRVGAERPPVSAVVALLPPAVEDAEAGNAVQPGLHAARPARLERGAWVVEPKIDARDQPVRRVHVVVLEERDPSGELGIARRAIDRLQERLAVFVG